MTFAIRRIGSKFSSNMVFPADRIHFVLRHIVILVGRQGNIALLLRQQVLISPL